MKQRGTARRRCTLLPRSRRRTRAPRRGDGRTRARRRGCAPASRRSGRRACRRWSTPPRPPAQSARTPWPRRRATWRRRAPQSPSCPRSQPCRATPHVTSAARAGARAPRARAPAQAAARRTLAAGVLHEGGGKQAGRPRSQSRLLIGAAARLAACCHLTRSRQQQRGRAGGSADSSARAHRRVSLRCSCHTQAPMSLSRRVTSSAMPPPPATRMLALSGSSAARAAAPRPRRPGLLGGHARHPAAARRAGRQRAALCGAARLCSCPQQAVPQAVRPA